MVGDNKVGDNKLNFQIANCLHYVIRFSFVQHSKVSAQHQHLEMVTLIFIKLQKRVKSFQINVLCKQIHIYPFHLI